MTDKKVTRKVGGSSGKRLKLKSWQAKQFSTSLKALCRSKNHTGASIAKQLGVSEGAVHTWLRGDMFPTEARYAELLKVLDTTEAQFWLVGRIQKPKAISRGVEITIRVGDMQLPLTASEASNVAPVLAELAIVDKWLARARTGATDGTDA